MTTVESLAALDNSLVTKLSVGAAIFADISAATISDIFDVDHTTLLPLPTGYMSAGLVTTDGVTIARAITNDDVMAWQTSEVVRSDISKDVLTIKIKFLEMNSVTIALSENKALSDVPPVGTEINIDRTESGDQPLRRLLLLAQDTQNNVIVARYLPRVKVTDLDDQKWMRSDTTDIGVTITAYRDPTYGTSGRYFVGGPGWPGLA